MGVRDPCQRMTDLPNYQLYHKKRERTKGSERAVAIDHPPSLHLLSLPTRQTHDGRGKNWDSLFAGTQSTLSFWQRMWNHRKGEVRKGEIFFLRKWFMGSSCATHESTVYCGCLLGCVCRECASIGNKSRRIPPMRTASQVSQSKHSSFSTTGKYCDWVGVSTK